MHVDNTNELTVDKARNEWELKREALLGLIGNLAAVYATQQKRINEALEAHNAKIKKLAIADLLTHLAVEQSALEKIVKETMPFEPFDPIPTTVQDALLVMQVAQMQYAQTLQDAYRKSARDYLTRNMEEAEDSDEDLHEMIGGVLEVPPVASKPNLAVQLLNGEIKHLRNKTTKKITTCIGAYQLQPATVLNAQKTNAEENIIYVDTVAKTYSVLVSENNVQTGNLPADVVIPAANPLQDTFLKTTVLQTAVTNKHTVPLKILSQDPSDFAALVAGAGRESIHITNLPEKQPNLIIPTMRELLLRGIPPTVDEERLNLQLRTLSTFEKGEYQKLLAISDCMKRAREDKSNRYFDNNALTLFTKTFHAAETHPVLPENITMVQKAIVTLYASTKEGRQRMLNSLSEIPSQNGMTAEAYILKLLPVGDDRNAFKDLIAKSKKQQSEEVINQDIAKRVAKFRDHSDDGINILNGLLSDYKKNKPIIDTMLNKLSVEERLTLLGRLQNSFVDHFAQNNFSDQIKITTESRFNKLIGFFKPKIYVSTPLSKEIDFLLPILLQDANAAQISTLTTRLRKESFEKLHDSSTGDNEKRWLRFLAEENFANSFESFNKSEQKQISEAIFQQIPAKSPNVAEAAKFFVSTATGYVREYIVKNKMEELRRLMPTIETEIIRQYVEVYINNESNIGLERIKKGIALILANMGEVSREALIDELGIDRVSPSSTSEAILGVLAENGIKNASPSKIFVTHFFENPDHLQSSLEERIEYLADKPDTEQKFVDNVINDDMKQIVGHPNFNIGKFLAAVNAINVSGKKRAVFKEIIHALDKHCPEQKFIDYINNQVKSPGMGLLEEPPINSVMTEYLEQLIQFYSKAHEFASDINNKNLAKRKFKDVMLQICHNGNSRLLLSEFLRSKLPNASLGEELNKELNLQSEFLIIAREALDAGISIGARRLAPDNTR